MDTSKLYIGEVYEIIKMNNLFISKRIGYKSLFYKEKEKKYMSLKSKDLYDITPKNEVGLFYVKEDSLMPFTSFSDVKNNDKLISSELKSQIKLLKELRIMQLEKIKKYKWADKYKLALAFKEKYKTLEIPQRFVTSNGVDYDEDGIKLGNWLMTQRSSYHGSVYTNLTKEKILLLERLGIRWDKVTQEDKWMEKYNIALAYYKHYGNLSVPSDFKTIDGINYDANGMVLSSWLRNQRLAYEGLNGYKITDEQIALLDKISFSWSSTGKWMNYYNLALAYFNHHGNSEIPENYKTINGFQYDESGVRLGTWIYRQREAFKKGNLTDEQIELLDKIKMRYKGKVIYLKWDEAYKLAEAYYKTYGNLNIPKNFRTSNGIDYNDAGFNLYSWIIKIKNNYKNNKLSKQQIEKLNKIGISWSTREKNWNEKVEMLRNYYKTYSNFNIPNDFYTSNGIDHDPSGVNLSMWLESLVQTYKGMTKNNLTDKKIKEIEDIGFIWFDKKKDEYLQSQEITKKNKNQKQIEILNRVKSCLNAFDSNTLPDKETINNQMIKALNRKGGK